MSINNNRKVTLNEDDRVDSVEMEPSMIRTVYMKVLSYSLLFYKRVFKNKDSSEGVLYLVPIEISITHDQIMALYIRRRSAEVFHKPVKPNVALAKSRIKTVRTQINHFFASIYVFYKIDMLKMKHQINHSALRTKIYFKVLRAS